MSEGLRIEAKIEAKTQGRAEDTYELDEFIAQVSNAVPEDVAVCSFNQNCSLAYTKLDKRVRDIYLTKSNRVT